MKTRLQENSQSLRQNIARLAISGEKEFTVEVLSAFGAGMLNLMWVTRSYEFKKQTQWVYERAFVIFTQQVTPDDFTKFRHELYKATTVFTSSRMGKQASFCAAVDYAMRAVETKRDVTERRGHVSPQGTNYYMSVPLQECVAQALLAGAKYDGIAGLMGLLLA